MTGDHQIIQHFIKHHSRLWAMAFSIVRDHQLAEDTLQEVSIVLINKKEQYDPERPFVAWALGITRLQALKTLEKHRRTGILLDAHTLDCIQESIAEQEAFDSTSERYEALRICLKRLRPEHYEVMKSKYVDKMSARDISDQIDRTETATYSLLQRLRSTMLKCIQKRTGTEVTG